MKRKLGESLNSVFARHGIALVVVAFVGIVALSGGTDKILSLMASSGSVLNATPTIMYFTPHNDDTLSIGGTADIDVRINTRIPINALGATIKYPQETLEIVGISKERSFLDLWTEETAIKEGIGEIHFSGGSLESGGITGTGTVLTLTVRAKKQGRAELSFKDVEVFPHDGQGRKVTNDMRPFAYEIEASSGSIVSGSTKPAPSAPSADFNNDGRVSLADFSILTVQLLSAYSARYDLDMDGRITLSDISVFFTRF